MVGQARPRVSPQARGRELAREGTRLWREVGSVRGAVETGDVPSWLGFFDSIEHLNRLKGRCLMKFGERGAAITVLEDAVFQLPGKYVRERSGTLIDLATAYLLPASTGATSGADPEAAVAAVLTALELAIETNSGRNIRRIREAVPQFLPYAHLPGVQTLQDTLR
jgi:hypothetical protein